MGDSRSNRDGSGDAQSGNTGQAVANEHTDLQIDVARDSRSHWLAEIASQLLHLAREIEGAAGSPDIAASLPELPSNDAPTKASPVASPLKQSNQPNLARNIELARHLYSMRRQRSTIFGQMEIFGEPAWDILLDLYIAALEGKSVSVSSACIGSASPPTTGLRWIGVLTHQGMLIREHDPTDQRRVLVRLSDQCLAAMDRFIEMMVARDPSR